MAGAALIQNAFNAGELSSLMLGRQDVQKYASGLYVCLNAIPLVQGAWTRRPGTVFLHQVKFHNRATRVLPFQYSITQTYTLEFGHQYIRFFTSHGILCNASQSITSITQANPGVVTKNSHGYSNGDRLQLSTVLGMTQLNDREVVVAGVTTNTFQLTDSDGNNIDTTAYGAFTSGNMAKIFEVTTTITESELPDVRITQSADTLYILHPTHAPQTLVRVSATSWTLSDITFTDGPYDVQNTTATTLTASATTGSGITITASATTGINGGLGFVATDVGRFIRLKITTWGYAQITAVTDTTHVTATVLSTLGGTTATTTWRLGIWSATTGYPTCGTFFENRLCLAGASSYPQRLDMSKSGLYTNFSPSASDGTVADDNAISFTLNSDDVNAVQWMLPNEKGLFVGTSRGEWVVRASALNVAITPTNVSAKPSTRYGSADAAAIAVGNAALFVQRANRKLRELAYVFEIDGFRAPDMSVLASHITLPTLDEICHQGQPQSIVWGVRGDGVLLGFTYEREQNVTAWHRHELGGYSDSGHLAIPVVESIACVPAPDASRDELYLVVQRYINGGTKRYVEYMSKLWEDGDEQEDAFYTDCGFTVVNGSPSASVTGLWHLEGETVGCYVDGTKHIDVTVANGSVTLQRTGTVVTLGYFYNSDGQSMPSEGGSQNGTSQGKVKRVTRIGFWLADTLGFKFGYDTSTLNEVLEREWGDRYGTATPLFTGVLRDRFEGNYDKLGQVYWRADGPFPATVLAVMPVLEVADGS